MTLVSDFSPAVLARFEKIGTLVTVRIRGLSLQELVLAHRLAREVESERPDPDHVTELCTELGLTPKELR